MSEGVQTENRALRGVSLAARWVAAYALWVGVAALAGMLVLSLRTLIVAANVAFGWGPWVLPALDKMGSIFAVLLWLGWVVYLEQRYRNGAGAGWRVLLRRAGWTGGVIVAAHALVAGLTWVVTRG